MFLPCVRNVSDGTGCIRELANRYAAPVLRLTEKVETLAVRVDEYLRNMGAVWN